MNSIALSVEIKELFDDEVECFVRWQVLAITPEIGMRIVMIRKGRVELTI